MKSLEELEQLRRRVQAAIRQRTGDRKARVVVGTGTCGLAAGARGVLKAILDELAQRGVTDVAVTQTGCAGMCGQEPLVEVERVGQPRVTYGRVSPALARRIVSEHVVNGQVVGGWVVHLDTGHPAAGGR